MAEKASNSLKHAIDNSKEQKSDLTIEKGAPYISKVSRPRSPSSNAPSETMSKRPVKNLNSTSYQFNSGYIQIQGVYAEINGSKLHAMHQIPCISEKPNPYFPNRNFSSSINPNNQFNNPYNSFVHSTNTIRIETYNWENSVPFRPSFNWSKFDFSSQSQPTLYDPLVHSVDHPPPPNNNNNNNNNNNSESMNISISPNNCERQEEEEEEARSNNVSLPPLLNKFNNNEVSSSNKTPQMGRTGQTGGVKRPESKDLGVFKNALAEFMKELLRPSWQKGILSKETHKRVIRKAIEKVVGSMPAQQIPSNEESTKKYLSLYRPKIETLLQEYLEMYGKSEKREIELEVNSVI